MNNILKNIMDFLGFEDTNYIDNNDIENNESQKNNTRVIHNDKIVNLQKFSYSKVIVVNVNKFNDVTKVCDNLKQHKVILINLENMSHENSKRVLDFIGGACYALEGSIQKINQNIFVICPDNIEISGDIDYKDEI